MSQSFRRKFSFNSRKFLKIFYSTLLFIADDTEKHDFDNINMKISFVALVATLVNLVESKGLTNLEKLLERRDRLGRDHAHSRARRQDDGDGATGGRNPNLGSANDLRGPADEFADPVAGVASALLARDGAEAAGAAAGRQAGAGGGSGAPLELDVESAGLLDGEDVRDEDQLISIAQHLSDEHFSIDNFKPSVTPAN